MKIAKLVVIGDGAVGKTCMLVVYTKGTFPTEYVPTVFENYVAKVTLDNEEVSINIWDTAGQEDLESIRTLSYNGTDVFLLCFSVGDRTSYDNVITKWLPELQRHKSRGPDILLVGTKADLRDDEDRKHLTVSPAEGEELAKRIGAFEYVECSAIQGRGVKDVFDKAIVQAASREASVDPDKSRCRCNPA